MKYRNNYKIGLNDGCNIPGPGNYFKLPPSLSLLSMYYLIGYLGKLNAYLLVNTWLMEAAVQVKCKPLYHTHNV